MTGGSYFTGGGLADEGMKATGITPVFGIEYDDDIASVARANGHSVRTKDVREVDPASLPTVDAFHASPPCPSFSVAKTGGGETPEDIAMAEAVCAYLIHHRPRLFTLENVWGYRQSESWRCIRLALQSIGYGWNCWHLNAADYGVPSTRKRMIVAARRDGMRPVLPAETHTETPGEAGLFGFAAPRWVGWYEAVEDLLPTCPDSALAAWQMRRMPKHLTDNLLSLSGNMNMADDRVMTPGVCRANTVRASTKLCDVRAVLVQQNANDTSGAPIYLEGAARSGTVRTGQNHIPRAVLIDGTEQRGNGIQLCADQPAHTVKAASYKGLPRAVLTSPTVRVVQLTPRTLCRLQSIPDTYRLPESKTLACRVIGNSVPPLLMQRVYESLR